MPLVSGAHPVEEPIVINYTHLINITFPSFNNITEGLGESLLLLGGVYLHQSGSIPKPSAELTGRAPAVLLVVQFPVMQEEAS